MTASVELRLASGQRATLEPDRWSPGAVTLVVDGTPQSHVDLDDPSRLFFEYVQRIGHVIDEWGEPGQPMTAVHLGAGGLTLPRYIHATRPGSRQQVIELDEQLMAFVREHLPLPRNSGIRIRYGDARATLARLPAALHGAVDLVVVDVFSGARIPAHVTSAEFYVEVARLLAPGGIVAVNIADGPGLAFARGQAATLRVNAWPWAQVSVDEGPPRPTPHDFSLSPGTHAVRVQYNTGGEESLRVDLRSGEVRTLPFRRGW